VSKSTTIHVNGTARQVPAAEDTPLLYVLRNDLKLKGTRFGCGSGVCGSCTVLLDNRAVQSCNTPLSAAQDRQITTIEGLSAGGALHPLQQAFIDEQAGQCGYCLSGIIMGAAALLRQNPAPTEAEIRAGLELHICRCGSYERIVRAVRRAGQAMKGTG
jgi:nicotinate dehydrogenase subunit A